MRSLFLVGSPRSGCGTAAATLAPRSGLLVGGEPAASLDHPCGDHCEPHVALTNEALLQLALPPTPVLLQGERWLGRLPPEVELASFPAAVEEIRALVRTPFCHWDPRLVWTLPLWQAEAPSAAVLTVFRHPTATVTSLLEVLARRATEGLPTFREADAWALWKAVYARILRVLRAAGDWLFLHHDQLFTQQGRERLERFIEAPVDASALRPELRRPCDASIPDREAAELYGELCALAEHRGPQARPATELPEVALVLPVRDQDRAGLEQQVALLASQRQVRLEILLVDQTSRGDLAIAGARTLREPSPSRGRAYRRALEHTAAPWIAWHEHGATPLPHRLARQLAWLGDRGDVDMITADFALSDEQGVPCGHRGVDEHVAVLPGSWRTTVLVRRAALAEIDPLAFTPAELALYQELRARGRVLHVPEALVSVPRLDEERRARAAHIDAELLALARWPVRSEPEVTVLLASHDRRDALVECLEGFARQPLPRGTFEILLIDDGSRDGTRELLASLELAVPFRYLEQECRGACTARNNGLPHARGRLLLFVNDDTIPFPDTVRGHIDAQRALAGRRAIVLGTFEQPPEECRNSLTRMLETTQYVFGYAGFARSEPPPSTHFYTCNASVPRAALEEVGLFDEKFPCYAEDTDLGLRLEDRGYRIHYRPEIRAIHRHRMSFDGIRWRQRVVAKAHARLYVKHPRLAGLWNIDSIEATAGRLERTEGLLPAIEAAARVLSGIDLACLEEAGASGAAVAEQASALLLTTFKSLNRVWWLAGLIQGLQELEPELLPAALAPVTEELVHA